MNRRELLRFLPAALTTKLGASAKETHTTPIRTGLKEFDNLIGGLPPGSLTVLHGYFQGGKTTLAMNVAEHVAVEENRPVLYFLQSFSAQTLLSQMACSRAGVDFVDFVEGKLTGEENARFGTALSELTSSKLVIDDTLELEDSEIAGLIERFGKAHSGGLVIVDHLGRDSRKAVARCSQAMKSAAVRTGTAILATTWNEELDDVESPERGVGLSHADFAWQLYRWWCTSPDLYPRDEAYLSIVDRRTGDERLSLDLRLDEQLRRFKVKSNRSGLTSLREERLKHPKGVVYHHILKPGEEPPAGARLVYERIEPEFEVQVSIWESTSWHG